MNRVKVYREYKKWCTQRVGIGSQPETTTTWESDNSPTKNLYSDIMVRMNLQMGQYPNWTLYYRNCSLYFFLLLSSHAPFINVHTIMLHLTVL